MSKFLVDGRFYSHPKVLATPPAARGLWVSAGAWSRDQSKAGFVPDHALVFLGGTPEQAEQLVASGLWRRVRGGYQFHDWTEWQGDEAEAKEGMSGGGKLGNHRRWHEKRGIAEPGCEFCFPPDSGGDRVPDQVPISGPIPRSRSDFDFDLDQSASGQSDQSDARASGADRVPDASDLGVIADALTAKADRLVFPFEAELVAGFIAKRAANTGKPVGDLTAYVLGAIKKAPDIRKLIDQATPARRVVLADDVAAGKHEFEGVKGGPCRICDRTQNNPKHITRGGAA